MTKTGRKKPARHRVFAGRAGDLRNDVAELDTMKKRIAWSDADSMRAYGIDEAIEELQRLLRAAAAESERQESEEKEDRAR